MDDPQRMATWVRDILSDVIIALETIARTPLLGKRFAERLADAREHLDDMCKAFNITPPSEIERG